MRELILFTWHLKPIHITRSVHQQFSPTYIKRQRIWHKVGIQMQKVCNDLANSMTSLGQAFSLLNDQMMVADAQNQNINKVIQTERNKYYDYE